MIELTFTDFRLEASFLGDCYDYVGVSDHIQQTQRRAEKERDLYIYVCI